MQDSQWGWLSGTWNTPIGLFSLTVWVRVNFCLGEPTRQTAWTGMGTRTAASLLILQTCSAVIGARIGARSSGS